MSDIQQTLVRSVLKLGAGYLISKGLTDSSGAETLIAGALAAAGIVWGIIHRAPNQTVKPNTNEKSN